MVAPSGDHAGSRSAPAVLLVRLVGVPVPSALATKTSKSSVRSDVNAMRVPSGDQAGSPSLAGETVKLTGAVSPSVVTIQTSVVWVASSRRSKAIFVPSGDQAGLLSEKPGVPVILVTAPVKKSLR